MYLKALEMQGFKSFPEQTVIDFHEGLTAIVGPNGSGKSNVADAIRWVLGEQSARILRGRKMEDVVFNGTQKRRRTGSAEVSIVLDNQEKKLPIDFDTVVITRRYYRSGESEYLINRSPCRLKDIALLLADTGIGKDGYSMISQGKVDEILSDRSEDRRRIFDEAAGIVKLKMQKQESLRKLANCDQNLLRVQDLIQALERQLKPLEKQAAAAKSYQEKAESARRLDLALSLHEILALEAEEEKQAEVCEDFTADLQRFEEEMEEKKALRERLEQAMGSLDAQREKASAAYDAQGLALAQASELLAQLSERQSQSALRLASFDQEKEGLHLLREQNLKAMEERRSHEERYQSRVKDLKADLQEVDASLERLHEKLLQESSELQATQERLQASQDQVFHLRSQLIKTEEQALHHRQDLARIKEDQSKAEALAHEASAKRESLRVQAEEASQEAKKAAQHVLRLQEALDTARKHDDESKEARRQLEGQLAQKRYQAKTLQQLEALHEGYHHAVKTVMAACAKDERLAEGVHGPLGSLIHVDAQYEQAVDAALGSNLQHLVTSKAQDAARLIAWLKEERAGRLTFYPMDRLQARSITAEQERIAEAHEGYLGCLSEHIKSEACYREIIENLGGRILVVERLDQALSLSKRLSQRVRLVSLEGDMVHPGGSMTGGTRKQSAVGLLSRAREITKTSAEILRLEADVEAKESEGLALDKAMLLAAEALAQAQTEAAHCERKRIQEASLLAQASAVAEEQAGRKHEQSENLRRLEAAEIQAKEAINSLRQQLKKEEEAVEAATRLLKKASQSQGQVLEEKEALQSKQADLRVSLTQAEEAMKGIQKLREHYHAAVKEGGEALARLEQEAEDLQRFLAHVDEDRARHEAKRDSIRESQDALRQTVQDALDQRKEIQTQLFDERAALEALQAKAQEQALKIQALKASQVRADEELMRCKNRIWEQYQLSYPQLKASAQPSQKPGEDKKKLKALRAEIAAMGLINHAAMESYQAALEQERFLSREEAEVQASRKSLDKILRQLDRHMKQRFSEAFESINRNFQESFTALFQGGQAALQLQEDQDLLHTGIEVVAQPPGKRLQSLNLLSGGERALTAIALLFAIFHLRPAPFCVLDEIESALDDSNVLRFTDYIQAHLKASQFILITHRKGTMEAADRLYGVTMQERGVSKLISLQLSDALPSKEDADGLL